MKQSIAEKLLTWFSANARAMPWRGTKDAYKIWLSEIMLQQTQVVTVIPYFERFIKKYPDVYALANGSVDDVFKLWEGLGYYSRAKRLIPCARVIVEQHGGVFPKNLKAALALPGVGPYTAGAVLSIAYNLKVPAVDGNVLRVISRLFEYEADIAKQSSKRDIEKVVLNLMPEQAGDFTEALMELGATLCSPKNPDCVHCPLTNDCLAKQNNRVAELPYKSKKKKAPTKQIEVALIKYEDRYLMYKKEDGALLSGFWAFPHAETASQTMADSVYEDFAISLNNAKPIGTVKHVFTHQIWQMQVVGYKVANIYQVDFPQSKWVSLAEMEDLAISTAMRKVIKLLKENYETTH